ncbi:MAG TPA: J domain-containing protein [Vicinamibacterales bacterium]|nr:J domain-containing protein [Vicinamibacterales bacterium]
MEFKDYYATLGVPKTASGKELKQAYRKLARKYHPDVNPGDKSAEKKFKDLNEAYEVLGDPEKRKKYDELGANWRDYEQAQRAGAGAGGPFAGGSPFGGGFSGGAWNVNVGGPGGYRTMSPEEFNEMFGGDEPFSDFFQTFFGGDFGERPRRTHAPGAHQARTHGRDVEHEIDLSVEEAFTGATRRLTISQDGVTRTLDVRIPPGVKTGSRVRAAGGGEAGEGGGASGDLYLRVNLRPHPVFEVRGRDLYAKVRVPLTTAVLGGEAQVPTPAGSVRLKIPELTQQGQRFRLKGHGMPGVGRSKERGDLYASVEVVLPEKLSDEERKLFRKLQEIER